MANKPKREMSRKRLSIPTDDKIVLDWMEAQTDSNISIRLLISDFVQIYGITDRVNTIIGGADMSLKAHTEKRLIHQKRADSIASGAVAQLPVVKPEADRMKETGESEILNINNKAPDSDMDTKKEIQVNDLLDIDDIL